jgi:NAD(P) transhydrogenase subunit alpha
MKLAVLRELQSQENRVAAVPDTVKQYISLGFNVFVEKGAGKKSSFPDSEYEASGAQIFNDRQLLSEMDIIVKVQAPIENDANSGNELSNLKNNTIMIGLFDPFSNLDLVKGFASKNLLAFSLELLPRITRAQSMDVLSSQSNLAGYKSVIDAAAIYSKAMPMMMTAAGTVAPAKVFILGAGVAGLQAIATAKRLGAIVSATDVRPSVKEQVESLGGKFVMFESDETKNAETEGGYAKEMSDEYQKKQEMLVHETLLKSDIAICTALIPGRKAPTLIKKDTVQSMKKGSVIIDLAVEQGGNCEFSELGKVVDINGVKIVGYENFPSRISTDASSLYSKNILNFIKLLIDNDEKKINIDWDDEIIKSSLLTKDGKIVNSVIVENKIGKDG